ncbi:MAG: Gldg family protein, partial [Bacteroidales bacterium]|nr:Gldg family protein [Bacteroidales bacterium]
MTNETENKKSFSQMRRQNRNQNIFQAVLIIVLIVVLNVFSSLVFFRADLTKEKRFSISEFSKQVLDSLDDDVYIEIFLKDNDLPSELVRYQREVDDFMKNLCRYSNNIRYEFKNPFTEHSGEEQGFMQKWFGFLSDEEEVEPLERKKIFAQLYNKGLNPTYIVQQEGMGGSEKIIFAGAVVKYKEKDFPVNLLTNSPSGNTPYTMLSST